MSKKLAALFAASSIAVLLGALQPAAAAASAEGTFFALGGTNIFAIDRSTGDLTTIASFPAPEPGAALSDLVSDPATHRLFALRTLFSFDENFNFITTYQLVTVSTLPPYDATLSPDLAAAAQLSWDPTSRTLLGLTQCCPATLVRIDPTTGAETNVTTIPDGQFTPMVVAAGAGTIYISQTSFASFPPTSVLYSIDPATGAVKKGPKLATGVVYLAYDAYSQTLFAKTFCCPAHIVSINPRSGAEAVVSEFDVNLGSTLTTDPASHTVFAIQDEIQAFDFVQQIDAVSEQNGAVSQSPEISTNLTGYLTSPAFETPVATSQQLRDDFAAAAAVGAVSQGLATGLSAQLDAAASLRGRAGCASAANLYQAFITNVSAHSGSGIQPATASLLVNDAESVKIFCS